MKWILSLLAAFSGWISADSQRIHGMVVNAATKTPIPGCSVYINNSSRGDITNSKGEFTINHIPQGKYELVVSSIGYETAMLPVSTDRAEENLTIALQTKSAELEEVIVEPYEKNGWEKWGRTFLENFIGKGGNANSCSIKNKKAVHFHYSKKNERLHVTATEPLIIENKALGYRIAYDLKEFSCDFSTNIVMTMGFTYFQDLSASGKKMKKYLEQRDLAYLGSVTHFMRSLYDNKLTENGFSVVKTIQARNKERDRVQHIYFASMPSSDTLRVDRDKVEQVHAAPGLNKDSLAYYRTILSQPAVYSKYVMLPADSLVSLTKEGKKQLFFAGEMQVVYRTSTSFQQSSMYLSTPEPLIISSNGAHYPPQELVIGGAWSVTEKIDHLLPLDFEQQQP